MSKMDILDVLNANWEDIKTFGIIAIIIVIVVFEFILKAQHRRGPDYFNQKNFNSSKAAIIFKLTGRMYSIRISQVPTKKSQQSHRTYDLHQKKGNQILLLEPGYYFIDELTFYTHGITTRNANKVQETYYASDWISPDQELTVPTGAFYVAAGQTIYLGNIIIIPKIKKHIIKSPELKLYTEMLAPPTKEEEPTLIQNIGKILYKIFIINPKSLGFITRHTQGSLSEVKQWFSRKHPMIPAVPSQAKYYLPGEKVKIEDR